MEKFINIMFIATFFCLSPAFLFASGQMNRLVAAGYSAEETRQILSGNKTSQEVNRRYKMRALGYSEQQVAAFEQAERAARMTCSKSEGTLMQVIKDASVRNGLDPGLLTALIKAESNFIPNAVSPKGARGLTQLMPGTARLVGVKNVHNPVENIHGGARYLAEQMRRFGRKDLALAAYNAGPGAIKGNQVPQIVETVAYVKKVLEYERRYK
jgi:soluble lytic murein transglycosylase-like protein